MSVPLLALSFTLPFVQAALSVIHIVHADGARRVGRLWRCRLVTFALHLMQPVARLLGQITPRSRTLAQPSAEISNVGYSPHYQAMERALAISGPEACGCMDSRWAC